MVFLGRKTKIGKVIGNGTIIIGGEEKTKELKPTFSMAMRELETYQE